MELFYFLYDFRCFFFSLFFILELRVVDVNVIGLLDLFSIVWDKIVLSLWGDVLVVKVIGFFGL